ncbi:MAG: hypothetical protein AAF568_01835, partial [Pseudomonadota bacterium]
KRALAGCTSCEVITGGMASTAFNQKVSEHSFPGKYLWRGIGWLHGNFPGLSAYLGNYVIYICRK